MTITVPKFNSFDEFLLWYAQFQAERDARDAQREAERQARDAQREAERQARDAQREAEYQAREAEHKAHIIKLQADTAELERQRKEYQFEREKFQKAAEIRFARTEKQIGDLGNTLGFFTQSLVEPEICSHFQRRGFNVSSSYTNRKVKVNGEFIAEIDLTVENGDTTVLVEVKTTLKEAHVDEHIERLTAVQQANVSPYAGKKLVGAIAAINVPESVERYAIKAGFFVLYPVEEIVGVVNSDDFQPRVWEPIA